MNDVPPTPPPSDDIDSFYRRASALDPGRPSDRTREAVLAHARKVTTSNTRIAVKLKRRERWWRPAIFGTLAAAALAGLSVLPHILTPGVAPRTTQSSAQLSEPAASAAPTPQALPPPAGGLTISPLAPPRPVAPPPAEPAATRAPATPPTAKRSPAPSLARADEYVASTQERDAAERQRRAASNFATSSPKAAIDKVGSPQALRLAAETGDLKRLQRILDQSTDVNSRDDAGRTALLLATLHGQTQAVEFLLAHGANPNTADTEGVTPLSAALAGNHSTIIRMLEDAGAH